MLIPVLHLNQLPLGDRRGYTLDKSPAHLEANKQWQTFSSTVTVRPTNVDCGRKLDYPESRHGENMQISQRKSPGPLGIRTSNRRISYGKIIISNVSLLSVCLIEGKGPFTLSKQCVENASDLICHRLFCYPVHLEDDRILTKKDISFPLWEENDNGMQWQDYSSCTTYRAISC